MHVPAVLRRVLVLSVVAILVSCAHSRSVSVVQQYFDYWATEDVDGIMALIADEPEIEVDLQMILTDRAEIRAAFEGLFDRADIRVELSDFRVKGTTVTYTYQLYAGGRLNETGVSQAVVEGGRIKSERYLGPVE